MNFYPHHISDFNNATRHLTRVERSVYRDAIERYYDTEKALCSDFNSLAKRLLCFSQEEKDALKSVLDDFFTLTENGYVNDRCELEIEKYRSNTSAKARAGKASAEARKQKSAKFKHKLTGVEQISTGAHNQEPITNNQKPEKNKQKTPSRASALDYSCWPATPSDQTLEDWMAMRKRLKANVSQTVINSFGVELTKAAMAGYSVDHCLAECVTRGWRGFKFEWIQESQNASRKRPYRESLSERANRAADEAFGTGTQSGILEGCFDIIDQDGPVVIPGSGALSDMGKRTV